MPDPGAEPTTDEDATEHEHEPADTEAGATPEQDAPDGPVPDRYGALGAPLSPRSPFVMGFFGATGALVAYWLALQILHVGSVLVLVLVAMFLAAGLDPPVRWLMRRGLPRWGAVLVVIAVALVAVGVFLVALVPVITDQTSSLVKQAPGWLNLLQNNDLVQRLDDKYDVIDKLSSYITGGDLTQRVFGGVVGVGVAILGFLANAFVVFVMTLYFLSSLPAIKRTLYRFAPASRRERVSRLGDRIVEGIGGYVSGAFVVALCAGVSTLVFLFIVGLGQYAVALALVVALLDVIPMIGATIGAIIVCAIGFADDWHVGIALVIFYIAYQQVENYVIYPRVMNKTVDLPGLLTVVAALIGASLLGVIGALMAIPTAAAGVLLVNEIVFRRQDEH